MNTHNVGAARSLPFGNLGANAQVQVGAKASARPVAAGADAAAADAPRAGMRRRIESFVEHADRRLENVMNRADLTPRQRDALAEAQRAFHGQMSRLDRALDHGPAGEAMRNILAGLRGSIDAILREPNPTDATSLAGAKPNVPGRTATQSGSANQIDTLA